MSSYDKVFKLEKPKGLSDLVSQVEIISKEMKKCIEGLINTNDTARKHFELMDQSNLHDAFHNISQNIIDLAKLIQKKCQEA